MKQIITIIRPYMFYKTKDRLAEEGLCYLSSVPVFGRGKKPQKADVANHGQQEDKEVVEPLMSAKKMFSIFVRDEEVQKVLDVILEVNQTGHPGDGKIFILPCEDAIRIRTGETKEEAIM